MTIKHLVISGGGPTLFRTLGALQHLQETAFWKIDEIESIYGTSAGAIVAVLLCLRFEWDTLNTYFLDRPWHEAFPVNASTLFDAFSRKGVFDRSFLEKAFKPLFNAKDISMDITMKQFYEYSKIEIHIYAFELHEFKPIDVSHKTHPDLALLTALQMSSAIPILFAPKCMDGKCYLDGGISTNYPLNYCIEAGNKKDEILGFKNNYDDVNESEDTYNIDAESTMLDYISTFLHKLIFNMNTEHHQQSISHEVVYDTKYLSLSYLQSVLSSRDIRCELMASGKAAAEVFLLKKTPDA